MKILCVIDNLGSGGAQKQLVELAKGFKEKGHEVIFLTYHYHHFYVEELAHEQIQSICVANTGYVKRLLKMRSIIRNGNFDVVLSFLQAANLICELSGFPFRKWKLIVGERSANPNIFKSVKLRSYRIFHLFADYIVANSYENIAIIKKINPLLSDAKLKVIYNLVESGDKPSEKPEPGNELLIVIGASHRGLKNSLGMAKSLLLLSETERKRIRIVWYGDKITPPYFDSSFEETAKFITENQLQDCISFQPATTDFSDQMDNADIVALFSFYEGLPNVICEAMSKGKPVLASDVSDIGLLLSHNLNQTFDPKKPEEIVKAIRYYLNLDQQGLQEIGAANKKVAIEKFNKQNIINDYLKLMQ